MTDLIGRQTAIKMAKTYGAEEYDRGYENGKKAAQRWIPCSKRLPEPGEYYFVTRQYFGWNCTEYREIDIAKYDSDGWHKGDDTSSIAVLAWCELDVLKPWEGEEHGET